jgi:hypothetical protein
MPKQKFVKVEEDDPARQTLSSNDLDRLSMTDQHVKNLNKALEEFALVKTDMTAVLDVVKDNNIAAIKAAVRNLINLAEQSDVDMFRKKDHPHRPDYPMYRNMLFYGVENVLRELQEDLKREREKKDFYI